MPSICPYTFAKSPSHPLSCHLPFAFPVTVHSYLLSTLTFHSCSPLLLSTSSNPPHFHLSSPSPPSSSISHPHLSALHFQVGAFSAFSSHTWIPHPSQNALQPALHFQVGTFSAISSHTWIPNPPFRRALYATAIVPQNKYYQFILFCSKIVPPRNSVLVHGTKRKYERENSIQGLSERSWKVYIKRMENFDEAMTEGENGSGKNGVNVTLETGRRPK